MNHTKITTKSAIGSLIPGIMFWGLAIFFYIKTHNVGALFNFGYIGTALSVGIFLYNYLPLEQKHWGRKLSQFLVGIYLFLFLGIICKMNIQIEGVWFELLFGVSTAPLMHYMVAKIIGPIFMGRLYCGWACWTTMILDLLPFDQTGGRVDKRLGHLRYLHFALSILVVLMAWFIFKYNDLSYFTTAQPSEKGAYVSSISVIWFLIGNLLYYVSGIWLAFLLKDNRAFCKYLCPVSVFFKAGSRFSIMKIKGDKNRCTNCGSCKKACLMDVDIPQYIKQGKRVLSTECVLCLTCTNSCPEQNLKIGFGFDTGVKEFIHFNNK